MRGTHPSFRPLATALTIPFRDALKRVVITSSIKAAIGADSGRTYTEEDWADYAVKEVEEMGRDVKFEYTYYASKVLAERGMSLPYTHHTTS